MRRARRRYGTPAQHPDAYRQIEHELAIIAALNFPGYFLVVADIVDFCKDSDILCQGRGAPPTRRSAMPWASPMWIRWPTSCCSSGSCRRPATVRPTSTSTSNPIAGEAIQYVYRRYGRDYSAQVANVITHRRKSAIRDMAGVGFCLRPAGRVEP